MQQVSLQWPTVLAVNPIDESLYVLDNDVILRVTSDGRVVVVFFGRRVQCLRPGVHLEEEDSGLMDLDRVNHFTFSPSGDMYVVGAAAGGSDDGGSPSSIRIFASDGRTFPFAGDGVDESRRCLCWKPRCSHCADDSFVRPPSVRNLTLKSVSEVAVTPDGIVHFADVGLVRVFSVRPDLPRPDRGSNNRYEVRDVRAGLGEAYLFSRFGQHLATRDTRTPQRYLYNFTYSSNSYHSQVTRITDRLGNVTVIQRDYRLQAKELVLPNGLRCRITTDYMGRLQSFRDSRNRTTNYTYVGNTGLLKTRLVNGKYGHEFRYDGSGGIESVLLPSGEILRPDGSQSAAAAVLVLDPDEQEPDNRIILSRNNDVAATVVSIEGGHL